MGQRLASLFAGTLLAARAIGAAAQYPAVMARNRADAVPALQHSLAGAAWHRLDDGVMGGRSSTAHSARDGALVFAGTINTDGGGFASVRSSPVSLGPTFTGVRVRYKGDGKTYKLLLSNGGGGGPFGRSPSWQHDIATKAGEVTTATYPISDFVPSFGGRSAQPRAGAKLAVADVSQVGFMLSLKLSNGGDNPPATFGRGIFGFELVVEDVEFV